MAAAISLFGFNSGAALVTVVGMLMEVPVMLLMAYVVNNSKGWYERGYLMPGCVFRAKTAKQSLRNRC